MSSKAERKSLLLNLSRSISRTETVLGSEELAQVVRATYHSNADWNGPHPINAIKGADNLLEEFWTPLFRAFPDIERVDRIMLAGEFNNGEWVCAYGDYIGTFRHDWLGIPANDQATFIRYGELNRIEDGKVRECYLLLDIPHVMAQAGISIPELHCHGAQGLWLGPATNDGVVAFDQNEAETEKSLHLVEAMIAGLGEYDGRAIESMGQERFWSRDFMWYGPYGIGNSRGLHGFQKYHQIPFLDSYPDRRGGNHKTRIAEGSYVVSGGWPSVVATQRTPSWIDAPSHGQKITMRVMDFWRRDGSKLSENWVFIDILDMLLQCGVDVMARLDT